MILDAWRDGLARVRRAPTVLGGVFVLTLVAALPLAIAMRGTIESHLGRSLAAGAAADAVNYDWWQEFSSQASGLGTTFTPAVIGFAATLVVVVRATDGSVWLARKRHNEGMFRDFEKLSKNSDVTPVASTPASRSSSS